MRKVTLLQDNYIRQDLQTGISINASWLKV